MCRYLLIVNVSLCWKVGKQVETLDKDCVSQMRFGYIGKTLGRRVFVHYWNAASGKHKDGYWVHADSDMLKPQGWSATVGVNISAPKSVKPSQLSVEELGIVLPEFEIRPLMIFEMVNPIRSNELALGQVVEVLNSPWIFPIGTAQTYGFGRDLPRSTEVSPFSIPLPIPPKSLEGPAKFTRGMFVEVVDSHVTDLVCPARVTKILGPYVVLIRFIGWSSEYDQWKPLDSMDIFPIGWCELVGHPLTPAGDMAEESEDDVDLKEFTPAPEVPSTSSGIVSSDLQKSSKSRRKSIPKKLVVEVTQVPVKNSPRPRKPTGKRKSRVKDSDESEEEEIPVSSGKAKLSQGRRSILITPPKRPVPDGTRRSSRARAAPEFFGENVQRRNSRNTYLE
ncbi:unnamed protein product [Allacma fusca]|uniref:Uncharacterized protein n=1 Tax=Allacma fusca TaxID=39272 RepID=A0A8J2PFQ4_9HEXA|nr:unnamed protein product [Allacma fusca]